jgi:hypothetical protein
MPTARARTLASLITRVQDDFLDSPPLTLTLLEAQQRFGLDRRICEAVLDLLIDAKVLIRTPHGAYARFFPNQRGVPNAA